MPSTKDARKDVTRNAQLRGCSQANEASLRKGMFPLCKEARFCARGDIREDEEAAKDGEKTRQCHWTWTELRRGKDLQQGDWKGDDGIDYEEPAPAGQTMGAVEVCVRCCLQISSEHGAQGAGNEEQSYSSANFLGLVP